mgnify:CR=1 FL=1
MRPLVIFHNPCADGSGAAFAAWCKFGEEAEYRPAKYGDAAPTDDEVRGRDVYVLDFSYPRAELERVATAAGRLVVLDHHKTAEADLAGLPYAKFDMGKSGAVMTWEHLHPGVEVPEVLLYVEDRDLWRWALPRSREVSAALSARGVSEDFRALNFDPSCMRLPENLVQQGGLFNLGNEGEAILRMQRRYVEVIAATAEKVVLQYPGARDFSHKACPRHRVHGDFTRDCCDDCLGVARYGVETFVLVSCLAVGSTILQSEVGNVLAERSRDAGAQPLAAVWYRDGERGVFRVSLRSVGDFDVSVIAKAHGGGGHRNAAGFWCDELPWGRS